MGDRNLLLTSMNRVKDKNKRLNTGQQLETISAKGLTFWFSWLNFVPDMPCMNNDKKKRRGTSQQRGLKALGAPLMSRGLTPCQPRIKLGVIVFPKRFSGQCQRFAGGQQGGFSPGQFCLTASRQRPPRRRPALAWTLPARFVSGL